MHDDRVDKCPLLFADTVLTIANFRNTMETIERGKLLRRHMNSYSYVRTRARVFHDGRVVSRNASAAARV